MALLRSCLDIPFAPVSRCLFNRILCPTTSFLRIHSNYKTSFSSVPTWLDPYVKLARYDKPIGTWLVYLPSTWSIAISAPAGHLPNMELLALFGLGAILMRGAGCTINDLLDRKLDAKVDRTKDRPLACNAITVKNAVFFLSLQLSAALYILLQLNHQSILLGFFAMIPVVTYPLFKRFTYWPQLALGITLNWGILLGYSAASGHCYLPVCIPLYLGGILWTMTYDTLYSHQDIADDLSAGIKSLAILFGDKTKKYLALFHCGMLANLCLVGINTDASWIYFCGTMLTMAHWGRLIYKTDLYNPDSCAKTFKAGRNTGLMYFFTIVLEKLLNAP